MIPRDALDTQSKHQFLCSVIAAHGPQLTRFFASQLPDASEAQDLVQEVYLRLLRLERPDLIRSPKAYLYSVAANIAHEHRLKRSSRPKHISLDDDLEEVVQDDCATLVATGPEDAVFRLEQLRELVAVLSELPAKVRAALIWAHRDGHTYEEISARLSVPRNRVKKYLTKAMAHCRAGMTLETATT